MEGREENVARHARPNGSPSPHVEDLLPDGLDDPFLAPYLLKADHNQPPLSNSGSRNFVKERASISAKSSLGRALLQELVKEDAPSYRLCPFWPAMHLDLTSSNGLSALSFLEARPSMEGKEYDAVHYAQPERSPSPRIEDILPDSLDDAMLAPYLQYTNHSQPPSSGSNSGNLVGERATILANSYLGEARLAKPALEAAPPHRQFPFPPAMHGACNSCCSYALGSIGTNGLISGNGFTHGRGLLNGQREYARSPRAEVHTGAARTQAGGEFLDGGEFFVAEMETTDEEQVDATLRKLVDVHRLKETMTHPRTSKAFQKLVGFCSESLRVEILVSLGRGDFPLITVCRNPYGTYSATKLFEYLDTHNQRYFVAATLSPLVATLIKDAHGQYLLEFCLKNFSYKESSPILMEIVKNLVGIATSHAGCCMLLKCIQLLTGFHKDNLLASMAEISLRLALDPHGNYLVQNLLELEKPQLTAYVLRHLEGNFHLLSTNKYGSRVVESCLKWSRREQSEILVLELMRGRDFTELFVHPFGNFVIQRILSVAEGWGVIYDNLKTMIETRRERLRSNLYGSNVLKRLGSPSKRKTNNAFARENSHSNTHRR